MTRLTSARRRCVHLVWLATIAIVAVAVEASGQTADTYQWRHGTTLGGFAGAAAAETTSAAIGTALGWELNHHVTIEGRGLWLPDDPDATDFVAWLGALVTPRPATIVAPFASAGVAMYRATVDARAGEVPPFYQGRMDGHQRATFEDFALGVGGGANIFVSSHFAIRPEVTVLMTMAQSSTRTVTLLGVHLAYHFESHKLR